MKNNLKKGMAFAALSMLLISACSKNTPKPVVPVETKLSFKTFQHPTFGNILTDSKGKTLYFFSMDAAGTSTCTGGCETMWPIFLAEDSTPPASLSAADMGTITRADGKKQSTYKGWPLYYFATDKDPNEVKGDGSGGVWFVAKPDYSIMLSNAQLVGHDGNNYLENTTAGTGVTQYLTDAKGRTLYAFAPDKANQNTYTTTDVTRNNVWPIYESEILNVPSVLQRESFKQITVGDKKQLTYKNRPMYYFGNDTKRGETKGVSFPRPGVWPIFTKNTTVLN